MRTTKKPSIQPSHLKRKTISAPPPLRKPIEINLDDLELVRTTPSVPSDTIGRPLEVLLSEIEEDPEQPRREFNHETLEELVDSIRVHGVKTPISLRPSPTGTKTWRLNFGARRLRASALAGRTTIPAFIDQAHTDYQQVIENLQREALKPRELAMFIQKKLDAGDTQADIAKQLGVHRSVVTVHLALINPPPCLDEVYTNGRCHSPLTLYTLRSLHHKFPREVERWCATNQEITRKTVADLGDQLQGKRTRQVMKKQVPPSQTIPDSHHLAVVPIRDPVGNEHAPEREMDPSGGTSASPTVLIRYRGQSGRIQLDRIPLDPEHVFVDLGDGDYREVTSADCTLVQVLLEDHQPVRHKLIQFESAGVLS